MKALLLSRIATGGTLVVGMSRLYLQQSQNGFAVALRLRLLVTPVGKLPKNKQS